MVQTDIHYAITDTYGGEANYSWVKRGKIECKPGEDYSDLAAVRRVKKAAGWENLRCKREDYGDMIVLRPYGMCVVMFINFLSTWKRIMKYKGFIIEPSYIVGSDFTIKNGAFIPRKPTKKDIEYYNILDPLENMRKYCAENTIAECKAEIDRLLQVLNMKSNTHSEWIKLNNE